MTPALRLEHVTAHLGARTFDYDLALEGPQIVAITGASGSGKSTLFHLIAGFQEPSGGSISMNGAEVTGIAPGKRPLTYIFQDHNLFAHLDVQKNVALGISPTLTLSAGDSDAISRALTDVGLSGFEKRMTQALSGGEKQRVAFARALVRRRPFLLLDEAFASLDEELRHQMGDLLTRLQRQNAMMVLMISHDRREVVRIADQVVEIDDGRVVYCGNPTSWAGLGKYFA
ncbi:ATP-binding cassette domain-containing protein [Rhizobium sp. KVB221]|uniref:ATP-binding cassette domain-containing protein n=1 Tax=Rhizobium setariae TaxID=2801340 RepID=A0A936YV49_9HYPH|nr:ATP-binding cassette domain-containing protein [Rhizobium setariae]MBL0374116.1 ATP-binding cassette domain-containing protein [Rhizobium setariae]